MKHARSDYDPIQDPRGVIPEDEPVFLLRGQDRFAPIVVKLWALLAEAAGCSELLIAAAEEQAEEMVRWQDQHSSKTPDMDPRYAVFPPHLLTPDEEEQ